MNVSAIRQEYQPSFYCVPEVDEFLELFPHRHSYIWAEEHDAGRKPNWNTEHKHLLSDRIIRQGGKLYGVRFGKTTHYLMLDIDRGSAYHPAHDDQGIPAIIAALEPLGLYEYVPVTSSYSGGIHLYFPFCQGQQSWAIARAAAALLESKNLKLIPGQLEVFPHPRRYSESLGNYNAHRLPLQVGSYLLNSSWETVKTYDFFFVERWRAAEAKNDTDMLKVARVIKQFERRGWGFIKADARKFRDDLDSEIEPGWTGYGQTNRILGRIAMREYIFHHVTHPSGEMLSGADLAREIVDIAEHLPGFSRWCRHQRDLFELAFYWARSIESSPKYYRYGGKQLMSDRPSTELTWNQQQALQARERIKTAVASLIAADEFPSLTRARLTAIKAHGIGTDALYRNKDLWHPHEMLEPATGAEIRPVIEESDQPETLEPATGQVIRPSALISFIGRSECPPQEGNSDSPIDSIGGRGGLSTDPPPSSGIEYVKACLKKIRHSHQSDPPPDSAPPDQAWFRSVWEGVING